ncbi:hypothetical protein [Hoeflea sp.]|uniref:hypothetical protein n=1 Tax=Hoeflea sp. TaxID=1940281 RepID=UPI00374A968C
MSGVVTFRRTGQRHGETVFDQPQSKIGAVRKAAQAEIRPTVLPDDLALNGLVGGLQPPRLPSIMSARINAA